MSKTNATGIHPFELIDRFGVDSYRWYFLREVQFGQDGSFSLESMVDRHNAELANGIGNLASRVLAMLASYFDGVSGARGRGAESDLPQVVADATRRYDEEMSRSARRRRWPRSTTSWSAPIATWSSGPVDARQGPGAASELGDPLRIGGDPAGPRDPALGGDAGAAQRLWDQLGTGQTLESNGSPMRGVGRDGAGTVTTKGDSLFPRVDVDD